MESSLDELVTIDSLVRDFRDLGIAEGMTLIVHLSLRSLGWVSGGPVAVILALEEVLGQDGTLVMPAHTTDLSDPSQWKNPPVPNAWWQTIRETMPAFLQEARAKVFPSN
jgi:aminoglycoside 3-N-acetyltransferase